MSDERSNKIEPVDEGRSSMDAVGESKTVPPKRELVPLPGLVAISFYLLLLAVVIVIGVVGGHYPLIFRTAAGLSFCGMRRTADAVSLGVGDGAGCGTDAGRI